MRGILAAFVMTEETPVAMTDPIYKILPATEWAEATTAGSFRGSAVDLEDGYIHFSTASQVRETAAKHFAGKTGLLLLTVDPDRCPSASMKWEASRGGQLFPHLYEAMPVAAVTRVDELPLEGDGHRFPPDLPAA